MKLPPYLIAAAFACLAAFPASGGEWVNITDSFTKALKPGYAGPCAGIAVDRGDGAVFVVVSDLGLWRSRDKGGTFARCDGEALGGRAETGWALQADPAGKRLACFLIYGSSGITEDGGETWKAFKTSHLDYGSVDWADTGKRLLALRHESGGVLTTSADAGETWQDLGNGFSGCGVLDARTFVATKEGEPGIFRSADAGKTWEKVHGETPASPVPAVFEGVAYWPTGKGVLASQDRGATWQDLGAAVEASYGPFFKTSQHFVVAGKSGFHETKDGGKTWENAAPKPDGFPDSRVGPNYAWDPNADCFYASTMTKPAFRYQR